MASQLVREEDPGHDQDHLPPSPTRVVLKSHPKAPYLGPAISEERAHLSAFGTGDLLQKTLDCFPGAANGNAQPRSERTTRKIAYGGGVDGWRLGS